RTDVRRVRPCGDRRGSVRGESRASTHGRANSETSVDDTVSEPNNDTDDELAGLGDEEARDQLIEVVKDLEAGGLSLEESLALWERGERLARLCERHLEGARERIDAALATVEQSPEEAAEDDEDGGEAAEDSS